MAIQKLSVNALSEGTIYTDERVDDRVSTMLIGGNNITATYDDTAGTLTLDGQPGYTDSDVNTFLASGTMSDNLVMGSGQLKLANLAADPSTPITGGM